MNYNELPSRGKSTSDGEKTRDCHCGGRCYVFYDESERYHVECERCGEVAKYKTNSADKAIKVWNSKKKTFDEMIRDRELTNAARLMAKGYYESGKMGYTRKLLIENLADKVDSLEQIWIPVGESLPKCDKYGEVDVLVCMDDEFIATANYVKNEGFELWAESGKVTHWMPLPAPVRKIK